MTKPTYDVFISHAGEDKEPLALLIYDWLLRCGMRVFLDRRELRVGEKASDAMIHAMKTAKVGLFILSPEFAAKKWTMKELVCFLLRAEALGSTAAHNCTPVLIPVFYRLSVSECKNRLVFIKYGDIFPRHGFMDRMESGETSMKTVLDALADLAQRTGIENRDHITNDMTDEMKQGRARLTEQIGAQVVRVVRELSSEASQTANFSLSSTAQPSSFHAQPPFRPAQSPNAMFNPDVRIDVNGIGQTHTQPPQPALNQYPPQSQQQFPQQMHTPPQPYLQIPCPTQQPYPPWSFGPYQPVSPQLMHPPYLSRVHHQARPSQNHFWPNGQYVHPSYQPSPPNSPEAAMRLPTSAFKPSGRKKALVVAINYTYPENNPTLKKCAQEVESVHNVLVSKFGFANQEFVILTNEEVRLSGVRSSVPTRETIVAELEWLIADSKEGDSLWFSFSGHGQIRGGENCNQLILPVDHDEQGCIEGDEIYAMMMQVARGARLTVALDLCHSKKGWCLPYRHSVSKEDDNGGNDLRNAVNEKDAGEVLLFTSKHGNAEAEVGNPVGTNALTTALLNVLSAATGIEPMKYSFRRLLRKMEEELCVAGNAGPTLEFSSNRPFNLSSHFLL